MGTAKWWGSGHLDGAEIDTYAKLPTAFPNGKSLAWAYVRRVRNFKMNWKNYTENATKMMLNVLTLDVAKNSFHKS